jgi:hypothetical protein
MKRAFDHHEPKDCKQQQQQDKRRRLPKCVACKTKVGEQQGVYCAKGDNPPFHFEQQGVSCDPHFHCFPCITGRVEPKHRGEFKFFKIPTDVPCFSRACSDAVWLDPYVSIEKQCPNCTFINRNEFRLNIKCLRCEHEYCSLCKLPGTHNGLSCRDRADVTWRANRLSQLLAVKCPAEACNHAYMKEGPGNDMQCLCAQRFSATTGEPYVDAQLYFCQLSWDQHCYSEDCKARGHQLVRDSDVEHARNTLIRREQALEKLESELQDRRNLALLILAMRHEPESVFAKVETSGGVNLVKDIFKFI